MPIFEIRCRNNPDQIRLSCEGATFREVIQAVVRQNRYTGGLDLRDTDLDGADLRGTYLSSSDFRGARLNLLNFSRARLTLSDFRGCQLGSCMFAGADLQDCIFTGARLNWTSHELIAEILRRAAGRSVERLMVAGLIRVTPGNCWADYLKAGDRTPRRRRQQDWALDALAPYAVGDDRAPRWMRDRAIARGLGLIPGTQITISEDESNPSERLER